MTLRVVCAWCSAVIRDGDDSELVSHGCCEDCAAGLLAGSPVVVMAEQTDEARA